MGLGALLKQNKYIWGLLTQNVAYNIYQVIRMETKFLKDFFETLYVNSVPRNTMCRNHFFITLNVMVRPTSCLL